MKNLNFTIIGNPQAKFMLSSSCQVECLLTGYNSEYVIQILSSIIESGNNLVVIGESGAGERTLLSSLLNYINPNDSVILYDESEQQVNLKPDAIQLISGSLSDAGIYNVLQHSKECKQSLCTANCGSVQYLLKKIINCLCVRGATKKSALKEASVFINFVAEMKISNMGKRYISGIWKVEFIEPEAILMTKLVSGSPNGIGYEIHSYF